MGKFTKKFAKYKKKFCKISHFFEKVSFAGNPNYRIKMLIENTNSCLIRVVFVLNIETTLCPVLVKKVT